ncbi:MAG: hypothetical protein LBQ66_05405 [Planctomycetaceae bacterium]|nr:hypothetical protein [Planctomycetaceae bacterium]
MVVLLLSNFILSVSFAQNTNIGEFGDSGTVVLKRSIDTISRLIRFECDIRLSTYVGGVEFPASGKYEEQAVAVTGDDACGSKGEVTNDSEAKNNTSANSQHPQFQRFQRTMYRQEIYFTMDTPSVQYEPNRVILVCYPGRGDDQNGSIWQFRSIEGVKTLHQINISEVEAAVKKSLLSGKSLKLAGGGVDALSKVADNHELRGFTQVGAMWNLGGMVGMLGQIDRFYEFSVIPVEETVLDVRVFKLAGRLRKAYFDVLLKNHGGLGKKGKYPEDIPCDIEVYVGVKDSFPYKIRYLNRKTEQSKPTNLLLEINYLNVSINGTPIPEHRFSTFQHEVPAGVRKIDPSTEQYIKSLGL